MKKLLVIAAAVAFTGSTFAQSAPAAQTTKPAPAKKEAAPAKTTTAAPAKTDAKAPAHHTAKKSSKKHTSEKKAETAPAQK